MSKLKNLNTQLISNIKTHALITAAKRNLILSILKSTTTKREARNYLNKYRSQFDFSDINFESDNLNTRETQRDIFINRYLNKQNPFINIYDDNSKVDKIPLRLAIFKIRLDHISPRRWSGIAETFQRLVHLGISPIIVLDYDRKLPQGFKNIELYTIEQANKVMAFFSKSSKIISSGPLDSLKTSVLRSVFNIKNTKLQINSLEEVLIPLYQGIIPIIQPIVYNADTTFQEVLGADDILSALVKSLVEVPNSQDLLSVEKIVMIDPIGGIPSIERNQTSHVFINLSQEYSDIVAELFIGHIDPEVRDLHLKNLATMNKILQSISEKSGNDDATGIITTPYIMSINNDELNPIVYNVLTDRPVISSSLPSALRNIPQLSTSIIKKGMEVTIIDADNYIHKKFTLHNLIEDGLIDKRKLVDLINDSFGKELKQQEYLQRINESIASIIIIGDYDGGAIITWEKGPGAQNHKIAYLDKFAIAKRNQGLPGLADVVFKAVLQASPQELIWRSRKNNPVNKWYFERSIGSISNPDSQWKIFYTGEIFNKKLNLQKNSNTTERMNIGKKLKEYSTICESIEPSFK